MTASIPRAIGSENKGGALFVAATHPATFPFRNGRPGMIAAFGNEVPTFFFSFLPSFFGLSAGPDGPPHGYLAW